MDEVKEKTVLIREILVAIDTSRHSHAALEAAASLARAMEANIQGIFVHDEIWNRVSRLPSISAINTLTGQVSPFEDDTMQERAKLLENRLRQRLQNIGRRYQITHSWHSSHGKVEEEILKAGRETDLITIGLKGASARRKILGSSARRVIEQTEKPILILKEGLRLGATISAVYDGSKESKKGIVMALSIAERNESTLTILFVNNDPEKRKERIKELENILRETTIFAEIELLDQPNAGQFFNSLNQQKSGLLIVPKNQPLLRRSLQVFLNHINCPLLMMS